MVQLTPGEVRVEGGGEHKQLAISGGFAEVLGDKISIFAETAEMAGEIDAERARQSLERAKAESKRKDIDPMTLAQAEAAVRRAEVRLRVSMLKKLPKRARPSR